MYVLCAAPHEAPWYTPCSIDWYEVNMNWYLSTYNGETLLIYDGMLVDTYSSREEALKAMEAYNESYALNERVGCYEQDTVRITNEGVNAKR